MINAANFSLDPGLQVARKPDVTHAAGEVTGPSTTTAPLTTQAVKTLSGLDRLRNDPRQHQQGDDERLPLESGIGQQDTRYEISFDKDSGRRVIKLLTATTGHVLWQAPEEKILERVRVRKEFLGSFADKEV